MLFSWFSSRMMLYLLYLLLQVANIEDITSCSEDIVYPMRLFSTKISDSFPLLRQDVNPC